MTTAKPRNPAFETLPLDFEAEMSLCGVLLRCSTKDTILRILGRVQSTDCYATAHQLIIQAVLDAADLGTVDILSVKAAAEKAGVFEKLGGAEYLATCHMAVASIGNGEFYAGRVLEKARLRRLAYAADLLSLAARNPGAEPDKLLAEHEAELAKVAATAEQRRPMTIRSVVHALVDELSDSGESSGLTGLVTGVEPLDALTGGLAAAYVIIAGRPSVGKSTLALNICEHVAEAGKKVAVFSFEMPERDVGLNVWAHAAGISGNHFRTRRTSGLEISTAIIQASKLPETFFLIDNCPRNSWSFAARARSFVAQETTDLIVIDYIQLIEGRGDKPVQQVADISRTIKNLVGELGIPIIAVSQLSRNSEFEKRRPQLSDLRESGSLEQDADLVLLLWRHEDIEGAVRMELAKQRNGARGEWCMVLHGPTFRFFGI